MERLHDVLNIFLTLQYLLKGRYIFFIFEYKMCLIAYEKTDFNPFIFCPNIVCRF